MPVLSVQLIVGILGSVKGGSDEAPPPPSPLSQPVSNKVLSNSGVNKEYGSRLDKAVLGFKLNL